MATDDEPPRAHRRGHHDDTCYQRGDRWCAQGSVPGNPKRLTAYGATKAEARRNLQRKKQELQTGTLTRDGTTLVRVYLLHWLDTKRMTVEPSTWIRYEQYVRVHALPTLGKLRLGQLRPAHLTELYAERLAAGASTRTVHHLHVYLKSALAQAVRLDLVERNVADLVEPPKVVQREMQALSPQQARRLVVAIREDPLKALWLLALTTGMREGELLALRWSDIDLDAGAIRVVRKIRRVRGLGLAEGPPKTKSGRRPIPLTGIACRALEWHRGQLQVVSEGAGARWEERGLVFPNSVGRPRECSNLLHRSWYPLLERAGLPRLRIHDLRHSTATLMLALGIHPAIVSKLLGHADSSVTLDVYSHVLPSMSVDAVGQLETLLTQPDDEVMQ